MVFGSPKARTLEDGDEHGAWARTKDTFHAVLPTLEARNVLLCQESLPPPECDFIQTADEAARLVRQIDHPHFRLMLDAKSMAWEDRPSADIIREFAPLVEHFHANDANRRGPGFGDTDFPPDGGRPARARLRRLRVRRGVRLLAGPGNHRPRIAALSARGMGRRGGTGCRFVMRFSACLPGGIGAAAVTCLWVAAVPAVARAETAASDRAALLPPGCPTR
jgi:hypothetical protein